MPELPEVENTRRYLVDVGLPGRTFTGVEIGWSKTVQLPSVDAFVSGIKGRRVREVKRRGKYILLPLSRDDSPSAPTLIVHLGMTGGLRVEHASQPAHPMLRHTFTLDDGSELRFIDGRKFGKLWLTDDSEKVLPALGPEPLTDGFTLEGLALSFKGRSAPVKALLLEQSIVAGVGNIYADESLFLAGIHPLRPASELSAEDVLHLKDSIVVALTHAVHAYEQSRNEGWPDPPMALDAWSIPRKDGGSCPRCNGPVSAIRVRGRGTFFCPRCQEQDRASI